MALRCHYIRASEWYSRDQGAASLASGSEPSGESVTEQKG
jgi:hypothetical protein